MYTVLEPTRCLEHLGMGTVTHGGRIKNNVGDALLRRVKDLLAQVVIDDPSSASCIAEAWRTVKALGPEFHTDTD